MTPAAAWVLSLIVHLAPPARMAALPAFPGMRETEEQWLARESSIAEDVSAATSDPREQALLVAVAYHESGFAKDVDLGPCYRGPNDDGPRCDGGRAASIWQLQTAGDGDAADLFAHRRRAAARALSAIRRSARKCVPLFGRDAALRAYASGTCAKGIAESSAMVGLALRLLRDRPPPDRRGGKD